MIKKNKVSMWLGSFSTKEDFDKYVEICYDDDGNKKMSLFQKDFNIVNYDLDFCEKDWIINRCNNFESLLRGFSYDLQLIKKFNELLGEMDVKEFNCIILLYNYEYNDIDVIGTMKFIGCVDVDY